MPCLGERGLGHAALAERIPETEEVVELILERSLDQIEQKQHEGRQGQTALTGEVARVGPMPFGELRRKEDFLQGGENIGMLLAKFLMGKNSAFLRSTRLCC